MIQRLDDIGRQQASAGRERAAVGRLIPRGQLAGCRRGAPLHGR